MNKLRLAKTSGIVVCMLFMAASVFAYNPINSGDSFFEITSPELISGASSITGGGLHEVSSGSIVLNPALIAGVQRWTVDADYTSVIPSTSSGDSYAQACQFGLIIPSRYGVGAFLFQGIFFDGMSTMDFGNSITFRGAYAKDLTDRLYIGIDLYGGWGPTVDYAVACDLGFWYDLQNIWFMKNARWAVSVTGLGKSYISPSDGLYYADAKKSYLGSPFTLRVGYAADMVNIEKFSMGVSCDASFPSFQNAIFDIGMQFLICDIIKLSTGWELNSREVACGVPVAIPTAGLSFNFKFSGSKKDDSFMAKQGWKQNEAKVSGAYQYLPNGASAISAGFTAIMGQKDTTAPEIRLWEEE